MDLIGVHIKHVAEDVRARAPRPYETEALPTGNPVVISLFARDTD
jgi:hypothetical protein